MKVCNRLSEVLYAAISVKDHSVLASSVEFEPHKKVPDDKNGGIIVFAHKENAAQLPVDDLIIWVKDKTAKEHDLAGWTVGKFFKGRHYGENGKVYSEESLSVEIIEVSDEVLFEIGEELCREFYQESVLIKCYSERNRLVIVDGRSE